MFKNIYLLAKIGVVYFFAIFISLILYSCGGQVQSTTPENGSTPANQAKKLEPPMLYPMDNILSSPYWTSEIQQIYTSCVEHPNDAALQERMFFHYRRIITSISSSHDTVTFNYKNDPLWCELNEALIYHGMKLWELDSQNTNLSVTLPLLVVLNRNGWDFNSLIQRIKADTEQILESDATTVHDILRLMDYYSMNRQPNEALTLLRENEDFLISESNDYEKQALSAIYVRLEEYDKALFLLSEVEKHYALNESIGLDDWAILFSEKAEVLLKLKEWDRAKEYALKALDKNKEDYQQNGGNWNTNNIIHEAYSVLSFVALEQGEMENAKQYAIQSIPDEGSPQLSSFGPDMKLAETLLEYNFNETVIEMVARALAIMKEDDEYGRQWWNELKEQAEQQIQESP
jgi:tetratricopeptide (TPR) repeat protein